GRVHLLDPLHQAFFDEGSLFRATTHLFSFPRLRARTIRRSDSLFLERVRLPSVGTPHGVTGCRPPFDLPSPPPCGWSTGFIAEPFGSYSIAATFAGIPSLRRLKSMIR